MSGPIDCVTYMERSPEVRLREAFRMGRSLVTRADFMGGRAYVQRRMMKDQARIDCGKIRMARKAEEIGAREESRQQDRMFREAQRKRDRSQRLRSKRIMAAAKDLRPSLWAQHNAPWHEQHIERSRQAERLWSLSQEVARDFIQGRHSEDRERDLLWKREYAEWILDVPIRVNLETGAFTLDGNP